MHNVPNFHLPEIQFSTEVFTENKQSMNQFVIGFLCSIDCSFVIAIIEATNVYFG